MQVRSALICAVIAWIPLGYAGRVDAQSPPAVEQQIADDAANQGVAKSGRESPAAVAGEADDVQQVADWQTPMTATPATANVARTDNASAEKLPSAAERISRLEVSLETDEKRLEQLKADLNSPQSDYAKAEASFREVDVQRSALQQKLAELAELDRPDEQKKLQADAAALEKKWALAKERFDLVIGERRAMQESVATLQRKLESDRASVVKLKDSGTPHLMGSTPVGEPPAKLQIPQAEHPPAALPLPPPAAAAVAAPAAAPANLSAAPAATGPALSAAMPPSGEPGPAAPVEAQPILTEKIAKELAVANQAAQTSRAAVDAAEAEARTITERVEILAKDIALQRQLRDTARKIVDNSEKTLQGLNEELFRKLVARESTDRVRQEIMEATARVHENRTKSREISTRLDELQSQLAHLQSEELAASSDLAQKRSEADSDQAVVEQLKNPFTLRNLLQWLLDHGPKIVTILASLALFMWLSRIFEARLVELTAKRGRRGSREERENRAKTLLGVFRNVANIAIVAGGTMMILDEVGVPVAPIIGGAAVFGLAVAFGAQSLIKDYFIGFMVLLEQQYLVNDVIEIGSIKGQVERISLRITVLRDLEGRVHFVPHNQINTVTNLTHGWSRAVFDIGVAYKENVDRVIQVLTALAEDLRRDEAYRLLILSNPVMLGVDSLGDSAVVIKFYIQTRPLQQWTVKREMLRRIKNEFDRLGIEIPFPHMTLYRGTAAPARQLIDEQSIAWPPDREVA